MNKVMYNCLLNKCVKNENMYRFGFCFCESRFGCDFQGVKNDIVKWYRYNAKEET
jgi:hypothetical protein